MNATPSPIRTKTVLVAFGVIVVLAAFLGMLLGSAGAEEDVPTGRIGTVGDSQIDSQVDSQVDSPVDSQIDSQVDESGSAGRDGVATGTAGDSQYYDGGSIVRDGDGTIYYSDDNGNSISVG